MRIWPQISEHCPNFDTEYHRYSSLSITKHISVRLSDFSRIAQIQNFSVAINASFRFLRFLFPSKCPWPTLWSLSVPDDISFHLFPLSNSIFLTWSHCSQIACLPFLLHSLSITSSFVHFTLIYLKRSYNYCLNLKLILICFIQPVPCASISALPFVHLYRFSFLSSSMSRL